MGSPETLPNGSQVKCWWNECKTIKFGDRVPSINHKETYSIALREGGYANIYNNKLGNITSGPMYRDVFDKWGDIYSKNSVGLLGEDYLIS